MFIFCSEWCTNSMATLEEIIPAFMLTHTHSGRFAYNNKLYVYGFMDWFSGGNQCGMFLLATNSTLYWRCSPVSNTFEHYCYIYGSLLWKYYGRNINTTITEWIIAMLLIWSDNWHIQIDKWESYLIIWFVLISAVYFFL